ncbi:MAG: L-histidine N(alpha)-methyltransferase [Phycisphaeraceae bacterium]
MTADPIDIIDLHPPAQHFMSDVLRGLSRRPRTIPPKYFYDQRGSELFEQITRLPSYYPTRTEVAILEQHATDLADLIGAEPLVIEPGSGSSLKTRLLLQALRPTCVYMPIDISRSALLAAAEPLSQALPDVPIQPVCADFTQPLTLPEPPQPCRRRVVFFPGSTLGNFHPPQRLKLLRRFRELAGREGVVIVGLDLTRDPNVLHAAYDDEAGVTAAFNLNVLHRANEELGADFKPERFEHRTLYCPRRRRVEMHLASREGQRVTIADRAFDFTAGETILTECSYKFDVPTVERAAGRAGLGLRAHFTDADERFGVLCFAAD